MSATGGSVENVNVWGRDFAASADSDANMKLGGFEVATEANGNGTARKIKTRVPWTITGVSLELDNLNGDLEYLQAIADNNSNGPITISYADGETYQGVGSVSGELQRASMNATGGLEFSGPGKLTKQ